MLSISFITSCAVVAAIGCLTTISNPLPQTPSTNMAPYSSMNGQGSVASGTGARNADTTGTLGGNGMNSMGNAMGTPRTAGLPAGGDGSMTPPPRNSAVPVGGSTMPSTPPRQMAGGITDTTPQRNRTNTMSTVSDMGRPALGNETYGSGATSRVNNSSFPINTATEPMTMPMIGTASSAGWGRSLSQASAAAIAFILFA